MLTVDQLQDVVVTLPRPLGGNMPTLITGDRLREQVSDDGFIRFGKPANVEGAKYDLRLSPQFLKASNARVIDFDKLSEEDKTDAVVAPGEVVFVRTIEELALPKNVMAILSPKRKIAHKGIMILGGSCIDPLYVGPLWIGLYNFSSIPFPIEPEKKLIAALFYNLTGDELTDFPTPEAGQHSEFPEDLRYLIKNYKPFEFQALSNALDETRKQLDALSVEVRDDKSWKREFQENLDRQSQQIDKLLESLREEKDARKSEDLLIRNRLDSISEFSAVFKNAWVIGAILFAAFAGWGIPKLFESKSPAPPAPQTVYYIPNPPPAAQATVPNSPQSQPQGH